MANNPLFYDATVIAAVNSATALLNSGFLELYTGGQPALGVDLGGTTIRVKRSCSASTGPTR